MSFSSRYLYIFQIAILLAGFARAQNAQSDCEILSRMSPDGALFYFTRPVVIDSSSTTPLRFMFLTDGLSYYLALLPKTEDSFRKTPKLKEHLIIEFVDKTVDSLKAFDLQKHNKPEETLIVFFRMTDDQLRKLLSSSVQKLHFTLTADKDYSYQFDVNSKLLREALNCLLKTK